jgi:cobalt-zinc-cadmium efflux system outer membrane protein
MSVFPFMTSTSLPLRLSRPVSRCLLVFAALLPGLGAAATPQPLNALVADIVARHPELGFYEAEIAAAKAGVRTAGLRADPELSIDLGRKRVRPDAGGPSSDGAAWSVSVTQTFEWPGRLALRKAIANREVGLAELGLGRFRAALGSRVRTLAYGLHVANTQAAAVREVADRFTALKETFLARDPAGITPLLETRVIEAAELALQRRATEAELTLHSALLELNQLRGAAPDATLVVAAPALTFKDAPATDTLLAAAREGNFDFRMKRAELEQQGFAVRLAQNERRPAISVSPFYAQENADGRESVIGLGVSVPLPVTGRAKGATDAAEARRRQAETAALVAQRELEREVFAAAHAFATKLAEIRRWVPDTAQKFREAAALADRHYRLGAVPIATYVELQSSYLDAVEALLATQQEAMAAGLRLRLLTGLDFDAVEVGP